MSKKRGVKYKGSVGIAQVALGDNYMRQHAHLWVKRGPSMTCTKEVISQGGPPQPLILFLAF